MSRFGDKARRATFEFEKAQVLFLNGRMHAPGPWGEVSLLAVDATFVACSRW